MPTPIERVIAEAEPDGGSQSHLPADMDGGEEDSPSATDDDVCKTFDSIRMVPL